MLSLELLKDDRYADLHKDIITHFHYFMARDLIIVTSNGKYIFEQFDRDAAQMRSLINDDRLDWINSVEWINGVSISIDPSDCFLSVDFTNLMPPFFIADQQWVPISYNYSHMINVLHRLFPIHYYLPLKGDEFRDENRAGSYNSVFCIPVDIYENLRDGWTKLYNFLTL